MAGHWRQCPRGQERDGGLSPMSFTGESALSAAVRANRGGWRERRGGAGHQNRESDKRPKYSVLRERFGFIGRRPTVVCGGRWQIGHEIRIKALVVGFEGQAPGRIISQSFLPLRPPSRRQGVIPVADSPLQETERTRRAQCPAMMSFSVPVAGLDADDQPQPVAGVRVP